MRLTDNEIEIIVQTSKKHFGSNVIVRLFGSRVDDQKKGGDIDLLIKADPEKMIFGKKILFLVDLKKQLGDRKIDVVFDKAGNIFFDFTRSIKKSSVIL